jgi:hypothetical protein
MASEQQVKQYLAYWFQLGKRVMTHNGQESLQPHPVIQGDRYSPEFEACWRVVRNPKSGDCYLEGTSQTIQELLSPVWELNACSRCSMPVPIRSIGVANLECPCFDISDWPNSEIPAPRAPVNTQAVLLQLRDRLRKASGQ